MQGTGNNISHSLDTAKTVLVPVELYEKGIEEHYLRFNGMALSDGEVAVVSEPQNDMVAIMGISREVWESIEDRYQRGEVVVTSPLLVVAGSDGFGGGEHERRGVLGGRGKRSELGGRGRCQRVVNIMLTDENAYIAVWDEGLRMAEVLPDNSVDSLLYYMQVLGRQFPLRKFEVVVGGERAGVAADNLRRYYAKVRVVGN